MNRKKEMLKLKVTKINNENARDIYFENELLKTIDPSKGLVEPLSKISWVFYMSISQLFEFCRKFLLEYILPCTMPCQLKQKNMMVTSLLRFNFIRRSEAKFH